MPFDAVGGDIDELIGKALAVLQPPPDMSVAEWADKYRRLSAESSAMPGIYRTEYTEYMREPMEMVGADGVRRITCMFSAQVAKSTFIENSMGYLMHYDPCPILHVSPTLSSMEMFSKERLTPMLRDSPALRNLVRDARSRDSDNTIAKKKFPGGILAMVGSNAPAGLASRPIRAVFFDEVDRFERSAGTEGDPIALAIKRTTSYWNRIIIMVSTPGNRGESRIEEEFERGDQRYYHVPCPHCGKHQRLIWANVRWDEGNPDSAMYCCDVEGGCGALWSDLERNVAVKKGYWVATKPFNGNVSYHLNQIYSPLAPLSDGVRDFLDAKGNPELMKTWVNTFLGETWEDIGERLDHSDLMDQRSEWEDTVPSDVTLLTAAVDVQDTWLDIEVLGWGDDYETWSIKHHQIYGDLSTRDPWDQLEHFLKQSFHHPLFGDIGIRSTCIDSGGHFTTTVYEFSKRLPRVFAIKGVGGPGKPMVGRPSRNNLGKVQLFPLGVDTIKEIVQTRLMIRTVGPGYCHFPHDRDEEYFRGLASEKKVTKYRRGRKVVEWEAVRARNEPFDLRVYNTAALEIISVDLNAQRRALMRELMSDKPAESPSEEKPYFPKRKKGKRQGDWATGWKRE